MLDTELKDLIFMHFPSIDVQLQVDPTVQRMKALTLTQQGFRVALLAGDTTKCPRQQPFRLACVLGTVKAKAFIPHTACGNGRTHKFSGTAGSLAVCP